jgi:hypothetical protein
VLFHIIIIDRLSPYTLNCECNEFKLIGCLHWNTVRDNTDEVSDLLITPHSLIENITKFLYHVVSSKGARGSVMGKELCYKPEGRGFESR